jgi:hypothetical protein
MDKQYETMLSKKTNNNINVGSKMIPEAIFHSLSVIFFLVKNKDW